jgi:hypothetical protein
MSSHAEGQPQELCFEDEWNKLTSTIPESKFFKSIEEKKLLGLLTDFMNQFNVYISNGDFDKRFTYNFSVDTNRDLQEKFVGKLQATLTSKPSYKCYSISYLYADHNNDQSCVNVHIGL